MKLFVDTADIADIRSLADAGLIDGVTTNPSLVKQSGRPFLDLVAEIAGIVSGPVSAEVVSTAKADMLREGRKLAKIGPNVVVKLPMTLDGLRVCRTLAQDGVKTNVTLCFSANQGLLAAKAGATYISPFIGRIDDTHADGMNLIRELRLICDNYKFTTSILAASIRSPMHIKYCALAGADVATAPAAILNALVNHPLTEKGLVTFAADAKAAAITI